jgi:hypothetical protein
MVSVIFLVPFRVGGSEGFERVTSTDMTRNAFESVMDEGAARVLSRSERAYDVALETSGKLTNLVATPHEAFPTGAAMVLWFGISDLVDAPSGPMSDEMCETFAAAFSHAWQEVPERTGERGQLALVRSWQKHLSRYWRTGKLPA